MAKKIVAWMINHQVIDKEDEELYCYGIFNLIFDIVPTVMILVISLLLHIFFEAVIIMVSMRAIRKYSGGYHMRNPYCCCLSSILMLIGASLLCKVIEDANFGMNAIIFLGFLCLIPLYLLSPIKSCYSNLDYEEIIKYRRKTRQIIFLHAIIILLCYFFEVKQIAIGLSIGLIIAGGLLIIQCMINMKCSER